jgi:hypothetical protein
LDSVEIRQEYIDKVMMLQALDKSCPVAPSNIRPFLLRRCPDNSSDFELTENGVVLLAYKSTPFRQLFSLKTEGSCVFLC